jgi:hypothetical protein
VLVARIECARGIVDRGRFRIEREIVGIDKLHGRLLRRGGRAVALQPRPVAVHEGVEPSDEPLDRLEACRISGRKPGVLGEQAHPHVPDGVDEPAVPFLVLPRDVQLAVEAHTAIGEVG